MTTRVPRESGDREEPPPDSRTDSDGRSSLSKAVGWDWTEGADGRSNSSDLFLELADRIAYLIRSEAHSLLAGDTRSAARLILAQLAHVNGFGPLSEARQQGRDGIDVVEAYAVVEESLRVTAHIPERDIRAKYIITDLALDGWLIERAEAEAGFALFCLCGATMTGSGTRSDADVLTEAFWGVHGGDDHGPTTRRKAAVARTARAALGAAPEEPR